MLLSGKGPKPSHLACWRYQRDQGTLYNRDQAGTEQLAWTEEATLQRKKLDRAR